MSMECVCASQLRHFVHAPILAELLDLAQQILCGNFPCPSDRQPSPGAEGKTSSQVCGEGLRAVDRRHLAGRLKALCKRHCLTEEVIAQHTLAHHAANARLKKWNMRDRVVDMHTNFLGGIHVSEGAGKTPSKSNS